MKKTTLVVLITLVILCNHAIAQEKTTEGTYYEENQDLRGIWTLYMEDKQITMVLHQYENYLGGASTGGEDPEPWNAAVVGSINGDKIELHTQSYHNNAVTVFTKISGKLVDGDLVGSFLQADSLGQVIYGEVKGFKINPDISEYKPANVTTYATSSNADIDQMTLDNVEDNRFLDVTTQKDRVFYLGWAWKPGEPN